MTIAKPYQWQEALSITTHHFPLSALHFKDTRTIFDEGKGFHLIPWRERKRERIKNWCEW